MQNEEYIHLNQKKFVDSIRIGNERAYYVMKYFKVYLNWPFVVTRLYDDMHNYVDCIDKLNRLNQIHTRETGDDLPYCAIQPFYGFQFNEKRGMLSFATSSKMVNRLGRDAMGKYEILIVLDTQHWIHVVTAISMRKIAKVVLEEMRARPDIDWILYCNKRSPIPSNKIKGASVVYHDDPRTGIPKLEVYVNPWVALNSDKQERVSRRLQYVR